MCDDSCQYYVVDEISYCTNGQCTDNYPYLNGNQCISECDNYYKLISGVKTCVDECDEGEFVDGTQCVSSCSNFYEVVNGLNTCVDACSSDN